MRDTREAIRGREEEALGWLGIHWRGRGHINCPFPDHDDKRPSWRWKDGHWFCTCDEKGGSIFDAVIRMGIAHDFAGAAQWLDERMGNAPQPSQETKPAPGTKHVIAKRVPKKAELKHRMFGIPAAIYPYPMPGGSGIYATVARYEGSKVEEATGSSKTIRPWMFDGQRWIEKRAPNPWPPYRATSFASNPDAPVLWVEGEKSTAGAEKLFPDFIVSTSSGGAQQHKGTDYALLKGRLVIVWPDNDEPGRAYAEAIAKHVLDAEARAVRIVEVPRDWEEGWDLGDPIDDLPDSIDLGEMLDDAPAWCDRATNGQDHAITLAEYANGHGRSTQKQGETGKVFRFPLIPLSEIKPVLDELWLVEDIIPASGLCVAYGPPGCGKSFLVLNATLHMAAGREWAGRKVEMAGIGYIAAEGQKGFANRVWAAMQHLGLPAETRFGLIPVAPNLGTEKGDAAALCEEIEAQCKILGWRPQVFVIDTLARTMFGADENKPDGMGAFVANCGIIGERFGGLALPVHHTGWDEAHPRGHSSLHGAADVELAIAKTDSGRTMKLIKSKDGPQDLVWDFRLSQVEVGQNKNGKIVTTCIVDVDTAPKQKDEGQNVSARKPLKGQDAEFMKAIRWAIDEAGEVMKGIGHAPAGVKGVKRQALKIYAEKLNFFEGRDHNARRALLSRHIRNLAGNKHIGHWDDWIWIL